MAALRVGRGLVQLSMIKAAAASCQVITAQGLVLDWRSVTRARVIVKSLWRGFQAARPVSFSPSLNLTPSMVSASWCEPSRRRHFLLADWHSLKTMVSAVMRLRQPLVLVVLRRTVAKVLSATGIRTPQVRSAKLHSSFSVNCVFTEDHLWLSNAYQSRDKYCDKVDMIRFRTHVVLHQPNWSPEQIKTHISHLAFRERIIISAFVANDRIRVPASRVKLAS